MLPTVTLDNSTSITTALIRSALSNQSCPLTFHWRAKIQSKLFNRRFKNECCSLLTPVPLITITTKPRKIILFWLKRPEESLLSQSSRTLEWCIWVTRLQQTTKNLCFNGWPSIKPVGMLCSDRGVRASRNLLFTIRRLDKSCFNLRLITSKVCSGTEDTSLIKLDHSFTRKPRSYRRRKSMPSRKTSITKSPWVYSPSPT